MSKVDRKDIVSIEQERAEAFMEEYLSVSKVPSVLAKARESLEEEIKSGEYDQYSPIWRDNFCTAYCSGYCEGNMAAKFIVLLYVLMDDPGDPGQRKETLQSWFNQEELPYVYGLFHRYLISELPFIGETGVLDENRIQMKTVREVLAGMDKELLYQTYRSGHLVDYTLYPEYMSIADIKGAHKAHFSETLQAVMKIADGNSEGQDPKFVVLCGTRWENGADRPYPYLMDYQELMKGRIDGESYSVSSTGIDSVGGYLVSDSAFAKDHIYELMADLLYDLGREVEEPHHSDVDRRSIECNDTETEPDDPYREQLLRSMKRANQQMNNDGNARQYEKYMREEEIIQTLLRNRIRV